MKGRRDLFGRFIPESATLKCGAVVSRCPKSSAEKFIKDHHYSGTVVWNSIYNFSVVLVGVMIGAVQIGHPMNPRAGGAVLFETLEINRMAFADDKPKNLGSQVLSAVVKFIRHLEPRCSVLQTYADARCGKRGGVYRASGFSYTGCHKSTFYELDGETFHKSLLGRPKFDKRGWWRGPKAERIAANADRATPVTFEQYRFERSMK